MDHIVYLIRWETRENGGLKKIIVLGTNKKRVLGTPKIRVWPQIQCLLVIKNTIKF